MSAKDRDLLAVATNPDPERERKIKDEMLSLRLLAGASDDFRTTKYLKSNSREEREARAALARCVREQMHGFSAELLALAIDPYTPSRSGMKPTRHIRFESPARGKPSTWARNLMVIGFIRQQLANAPKLEAAINAACAQFKISRRTAQDIWKKYEQRLGIK